MMGQQRVRRDGILGWISSTAHDVLLALWRDGEPIDATGLPAYFESALIARPGYYD